MMQRDERSLGELFADLSRETSTLVRQEVELAKTELSQKATQVGKDIASIAMGAAVAYAGFLALIFAAIVLLDEVDLLPAWLAALLVGLLVAGAGYFLIQRGLDDLKRTSLTPERTIETLKEDKEWVKDQVK